jgi:hypothetical protein
MSRIITPKPAPNSEPRSKPRITTIAMSASASGISRREVGKMNRPSA